MIAIIVAAGKGERLGYMTKNIPKALVKLNEKELLRYIIDMASFVNVKQIIIIGGSRFKEIKNYISKSEEEITLIENKEFSWGNLHTLLKAAPYLDDDFLLFNVDHVFSKPILTNFSSKYAKSDDIVVFCDQNKLIDDQMRIKTCELGLQKMSKNLQDFDTGYIGLTFCPQSMVTVYKNACNKVLNEKRESAIVEDVLNYLAEKNIAIQCSDIDNEIWFEVDTPDDFHQAEKLILKNPNIF